MLYKLISYAITMVQANQEGLNSMERLSFSFTLMVSIY